MNKSKKKGQGVRPGPTGKVPGGSFGGGSYERLATSAGATGLIMECNFTRFPHPSSTPQDTNLAIHKV